MKTTLKTVCHCSVSFGCAKTGFSGFIFCFENGWTFFLLFSFHNWFGKKSFSSFCQIDCCTGAVFLSNGNTLFFRVIVERALLLDLHEFATFFLLLVLLFLLFLLFVISNMQLGTKFDGKESNFNSYKKWKEKKKQKFTSS